MVRFLHVLGVLGVGMGLAGFGWGAYSILDQHARLGRCRPVEATVIESRVDTQRMQHGATHKPVVRFKYGVDGALHQSDRATPGDESGRAAWAHQIVRQFPMGAKVTAYYDPRDPAYAFVVKRYDALPYTTYLFGPLMLLGGIAIIREAWKSRRGPREPLDAGDGWYQLLPPTTLRRAAGTFLSLGMAWQIVGLPAWLHYLAVREPPTPWLFLIYLPIYIAVGLVLLGIGVYAAAVLAKVDDAVVLINQARPQTGGFLAVRMEQPARRSLLVRSMDVSLICWKRRRYWVMGAPQEGSEAIYIGHASALPHHHAAPGELLIAECTLAVPAHLPGTTPPGGRDKIRYVWELKVGTGLRAWPPYRDKFELFVVFGEQPESWADAEEDAMDAEVI
jgi:hypothetical protein